MKKVKYYHFIMLLVFHCKILQTIDATSKAVQSRFIDISNAPNQLQVCLGELWKRFKNVRISVVEKWPVSIDQRNFYEICGDEWFQDSESLINLTTSFCCRLTQSLGMNEIVSNSSVLKCATLHNLYDINLFEKALEFIDLYKKTYLLFCLRIKIYDCTCWFINHNESLVF